LIIVTWSPQESFTALRRWLIERIRASGESARERARDEPWLREPPPPAPDFPSEFERLLTKHTEAPQEDSTAPFNGALGEDGEGRPNV
jgi:hypothetical protein